MLGERDGLELRASAGEVVADPVTVERWLPRVRLRNVYIVGVYVLNERAGVGWGFGR